MVWALEASPWPVRGLAPMRTPARCRSLRSGRFRVRPGGTAVVCRAGWRRPPANSGLDPWRHRPLIHAAGGACMRGQPRAMPSGCSWHSGDPDSEGHGRSTWNLANPGARVSRTLRRPGSMRRTTPSDLNHRHCTQHRSSILPWVASCGSVGAGLEQAVCDKLRWIR